MKNKSFRPEVAEKVENMEQYDIIFVAFPIWWYACPHYNQHISGAV